jgi:glycosyltransferase involved in cell wall biosynthesis
MPEDRVIAYYNTIDVEGLREIGQEISEDKLLETRQELNIEGKHVLLFSGRLYAGKRVDLLLRAFNNLKTSGLNVALLILGNGPERPGLEKLRDDLCLKDVHFLGECTDPKVSSLYFLVADLLVIPAMVGLAIVHGFAFGLPLITTDSSNHGPEIAYLSTDNGVMTSLDIYCLACSISSVLESRDRPEIMKKAATAQGNQLSLSRSVQRFISGIKSFADHNS